MIRTSVLGAILIAATAAPAVACSYPTREHAVLRSRAPVAPDAKQLVFQIAVEEVALPSERAKSHYPLERENFGLRGRVLKDGRLTSRTIEIRSRFQLTCFYPSDKYEYVDGHLIAWVEGIPVVGGSVMILELPGQIPRPEGDYKWLPVRWDSAQ